ncbi:hypothetical protein OAN28_05525 [Gammaproteobacteria bacterium]|nr:hypothetical protein [Gammaproteobacteria bacterium]
MKKLLLLCLFSSSIYSNEYLFACYYDTSAGLTTFLKINTKEQFMENTTYGLMDDNRIEYVSTYRQVGDYKETDRIIRIGQGTSKSIEHPDGTGTIEIWTGGYHAFDKLAGIYEWTSGAYDRTNVMQCKAHTKFIP